MARSTDKVLARRRRAALPVLLAIFGASPVFASSAKPAGDAMRGQMIYETRCTGCHSIDANRIGPAHRGVVGRVAGTAPGFAYSPALKKSKIVWTPENLDRWLAGPIKFIPGVRMGFSLANADDRRDVIAWLATQKATPAAK